MKKTIAILVVLTFLIQITLLIPSFKYIDYQSNSLLDSYVKEMEIDDMKFSIPEKNNISFPYYKYSTVGISVNGDTIYIISLISPIMFLPNSIYSYNEKYLHLNDKASLEIANLKFGQIEK